MAKFTDAQLNKFDTEFRRDFIIRKDKGIKSIVGVFSGAYSYIGKELSTSVPYKAKDKQGILSLASELYDSAFPTIQKRLEREFLAIGNLGLNHFVIPITVGNVPINEQLRQSLNTLPDSVTDLIMNQKTYQDNLSVNDRAYSYKANMLAYTSSVFGGEEDISVKLDTYGTSGQGYKSAFGLSYHELTKVYSKTRVESTRNWNSDPDALFRIVIEQYLSNTHNIYDICDELAGFYDPDKPVPILPRHLRCNCGEREHVETKEIRAKIIDFNDIVNKAKSDGLGVDFLKEKGVFRESEEQNREAGKTLDRNINAFDEMLNQISKTLTGQDQQDALQALANFASKSSDPYAKTVLATLESIYGIAPQTLSNKSIDFSKVYLY